MLELRRAAGLLRQLRAGAATPSRSRDHHMASPIVTCALTSHITGHTGGGGPSDFNGSLNRELGKFLNNHFELWISMRNSWAISASTNTTPSLPIL